MNAWKVTSVLQDDTESMEIGCSEGGKIWKTVKPKNIYTILEISPEDVWLVDMMLQKTDWLNTQWRESIAEWWETVAFPVFYLSK